VIVVILWLFGYVLSTKMSTVTGKAIRDISVGYANPSEDGQQLVGAESSKRFRCEVITAVNRTEFA